MFVNSVCVCVCVCTHACMHMYMHESYSDDTKIMLPVKQLDFTTSCHSQKIKLCILHICIEININFIGKYIYSVLNTGILMLNM